MRINKYINGTILPKIIMGLLTCVFFMQMTNVAVSQTYKEIKDIEFESEHYKLIHYHNWSDSTKEKRWEMVSTNSSPFTNDNDYAYLMLLNKTTGDTIFKIPSVALTYIFIDKEEKYIVGLSYLKIANPYQVTIFNISGKLIFKRHIAGSEMKLTKQEMLDFKKIFPETHEQLDSLGMIHQYRKNYYLDFMVYNLVNKEALFKHKYFNNEHHVRNHLSHNIEEAVSNYVSFYDRRNPAIELKEKRGKLVSISLLDPKGERYTIPIDE